MNKKCKNLQRGTLMAEWKALTKLPQIEYEAFVKWVEKNRLRLGYHPIPPNNESLFESPLYTAYAKVRGKVTPQVTTTPTPESAFGVEPPPNGTPTSTGDKSKANTSAIEREGDFWVQVQYDKDGNRTIMGVVGQVDKASEYQKWQMGFQEKQWGAQDYAARQASAQNAQVAEQLKKQNAIQNQYLQLAGYNVNQEEAIRNQTLMQMGSQYEDWRRRLLSELQTSPRSWIQYKELKNKENPCQVTPETTPEAIGKTQEQLKYVSDAYNKQVEILGSEVEDAKEAWYDAAKRVPDNYNIVPDQDIMEAKARYDAAITQLNEFKNPNPQFTSLAGVKHALEGTLQRQETGWATSEEKKWATPRPIGTEGNMAVGEPESKTVQGIPTPEWLKTYVPQLGTTLTKQTVAPISGQGLTNISPTNLEMLKGYQDWTGQNVSDWLHQTQMQLTETPYVSGRWTPKRQMY